MALSEARRRANARYTKENVKQVGVKFYPAETDIYEWVKAQDNTQGYIKQLIREDMEARSDGEVHRHTH